MSLIEQLKQIPDPRGLRGRRHPFWMLLFLSLLGFLCGYPGYRPLADFCREHQRLLRTLLDLPESQAMPSYSTFRRSFHQMDPQHWIDGFNPWSLSKLPELKEALLSMDGKSIRCTSVGGMTSAQDFTSMVSMYERHVGVIQLGIMQNRERSEIHVAQEMMGNLLGQLPPGQCVSLDALHTTKGTVKAIRGMEQDYLLVVKANRPDTCKAILAITEAQLPESTAMEQDDSHGRSVCRQAQVFAPSPELRDKWPGLSFVGLLHRTGIRDQKPFDETVYYIGSAPWGAEKLLQGSRQHWQIENELHWVKDVTFQEDYPPRRGGHSPVNWAILHTFAITLARREGWRTVPQALRILANQVQKVFNFLV